MVLGGEAVITARTVSPAARAVAAWFHWISLWDLFGLVSSVEMLADPFAEPRSSFRALKSPKHCLARLTDRSLDGGVTLSPLGSF